MKPQTILLSPLFLSAAKALTLPNDIDKSLNARLSIPSNESMIEWTPCTVNITYDKMAGGQDAFDCARFTRPVKGSVLFNPGGPGEPGITHIAAQGKGISETIGGHYDLIGFDPRGTGRTIPFFCNTRSTETNSLTRRDFNTLTQPDLWETIKEELWESEGVYAEACYEAQSKYGRFIGSTFVARDMLRIIDALDQGDKLNYYGVSYGTALGQVFISMFPDRVGRFLLDANVLADEHLTSTPISSTRDTEKALVHLFNECINAGSELCSLADNAGKNTTRQDLIDALDKAINGVIGKPLPDQESMAGDEAVFNLKRAIQNGLYSLEDFPGVLDTVSKGGAPNWNKGIDAISGISCVDSSFRVKSVEGLYSVYQAHLEQSSFAEINVKILGCARWKFSSAEPVDTNKLRNVNTGTPVLLVNGIYDPVTPISNAWQVSARLRESRVITHQGVGHGLTVHPSNCTIEAIHQYFNEGRMPKVGLTCKPDMPLFDALAELKK